MSQTFNLSVCGVCGCTAIVELPARQKCTYSTIYCSCTGEIKPQSKSAAILKHFPTSVIPSYRAGPATVEMGLCHKLCVKILLLIQLKLGF